MKYDIVIIGHIVKEKIYFIDRIEGPILGSPVAYSSVVAGKLGANVVIVTRIGKNMPEKLLSPIYQTTVDRQGIKIEGNRTTLSKLIYSNSGNKRIEYPQKAPKICFQDIPKEYLNCRLIYICPMDYEVPLETIIKLKKFGIPLAVDLGGYGGAHAQIYPSLSLGDKRKPILLKSYVENFDIVKASDEDCNILFGKRDDEEIADLLLRWGVKVVLLTEGVKGVFIVTSENRYRIPAFEGEVIDRTGAGDSFTAGFLVKYLETNKLKISGYYGSAVAIYVIERTGGVTLGRMPTREDVRKILVMKLYKKLE